MRKLALAIASLLALAGGAQAQSCSGTPNANQICAGPSSGGSGFPNFRAMVGADVPAGIVANSSLANMLATSVKCNPTSSAAAAQDCSIVYLANGGANPFNGLPLDVTEVNPTLAIASNDANTNSSLNNYVATIQTHKTGGATTSAALGLGGYADANNTKVWGLTSYATVMPSSGVTGSSLVGAEVGVRDFGAAGQVSAVGLVVAGMGNNLLTSAIQIQSNTAGGGTSAQFANGILFNNFGRSVVTGALVSGNSGTATWGVDFGLVAFSGGSFRGPGFSVDGSGNITGAIISSNSIFNPIMVGGNAVGSTLTLRSTNTAGTTDAIIFQVGNVGATEAARILDSGVWRMGTPSFTANGAVATAMSSLGPTGSHTTIQEWLTVQDSSGNVRYIPAF